MFLSSGCLFIPGTGTSLVATQDRAVHHGRHQTYFTPPFCDLSRFETSRENSRKSRENSRKSRENSRTSRETSREISRETSREISREKQELTFRVPVNTASITGCATSDPPAFSKNTFGGGWEDVSASAKKERKLRSGKRRYKHPPAGSAPSPVVVLCVAVPFISFGGVRTPRSSSFCAFF
jgi:hypothetical protein